MAVFECGSCGATRKVKPDLLGKVVKCPECSEPVRVTKPRPKAPPAEIPRDQTEFENQKSGFNPWVLVSAVLAIALMAVVGWWELDKRKAKADRAAEFEAANEELQQIAPDVDSDSSPDSTVEPEAVAPENAARAEPAPVVQQFDRLPVETTDIMLPFIFVDDWSITFQESGSNRRTGATSDGSTQVHLTKGIDGLELISMYWWYQDELDDDTPDKITAYGVLTKITSTIFPDDDPQIFVEWFANAAQDVLKSGNTVSQQHKGIVLQLRPNLDRLRLDIFHKSNQPD